MRILKAEITGFGRYHDQVIEFSQGNQLLLATMKSASRHCISLLRLCCLVFLKEQLRKGLYPQKWGRLWRQIVASCRTLRGSDDRTLPSNRSRKSQSPFQRADRRRGNAGTVAATLESDVVFDVFTFQQEQLAQIDKLQENELHQALISLGISGSQKMLQQVARYEAINQQNYKPRGQNSL